MSEPVSLRDLVAALRSRYDAIPLVGSNEDAVLAAYDAFRAHLSRLRQRWASGAYDVMEPDPLIAIWTLIDDIGRFADAAFRTGGSADWDDLDAHITTLGFLLTHQTIEDYQPVEDEDDPR